MRTNIVLDEKLVKEGLKLTGVKTKKDLVNLALKELVMKRKRKGILTLLLKSSNSYKSMLR